MSDRKIKIYISAPLSAGDQFLNVAAAIDAAEELHKMGFVPYVPHLNAFWHFRHAHTYKEWLAMDAEWLECCQAVLRLEGESPGAEWEVAMAITKGIPVFHDAQAIEAFFVSKEEKKAFEPIKVTPGKPISQQLLEDRR